MAIDASQLSSPVLKVEPKIDSSARTEVVTEAAPTVVVSAAQVAAALEHVRSAFNNAKPSPDISIDYLSGLSVTTVRSRATGEVVYQLPDTRVVELARLIKEGASLTSLGLLDTKA